MADDLSANDLVAAYRNLRDAISDKEKAHEVEINRLKEQMEVISDALLNLCNEQDMDSIRTASGTVSRRVQTRYWTNDWGSMYDFIHEHTVPHLLQKRLHNDNVKQFLEDNPDVLPVGLQTERKFTISVRKPNAK